MQSAILVNCYPFQPDEQLNEEFELLARSAGADILTTITGQLRQPQPKYYLGKGKVEEIAEQVQELKPELVIFNHPLDPSQERNLERLLKCRVLERSGLILDIFAKRAHTFEGKLQVELAQLKYLSVRLIRGWTHLERQKGGIGLRGPGETQLETDRRLIRHRIKVITARLEKVRQRRQLRRQSRHKYEVPSISLVGYTNAGKSTLFNQLTNASAYVADQLFATLDPTLRMITIAGIGDVMLVDTVGFIRELPHSLIDAFRATLEETVQADVLLHVIDACDAQRADKIEQVNHVLEEIQANQITQIEVYNKIDQDPQHLEAHTSAANNQHPERVWVSAKKDQGLDLLLDRIKYALQDLWEHATITLNPTQSAQRAQIYATGGVISETNDDQGVMTLKVHLPKATLERLQSKLSGTEH